MSSTPDIDIEKPSLLAQLERVLLSDREEFARRINRLDRNSGSAEKILALRDAMQASALRVEQRQKRFSPVTINADLPIASKAAEIVAAISANAVTIIAGATGSGKTTQIPKLCLQAGFGARGTIAHTQPRRIAARAVADRIADELDTAVGYGVGYKVRFSDQTGPDCQIKLLTDGMLLQETQRDPMLSEYDCIIIDEAHERSLNIDFLLGILHQVLAARPELRVVITSATINPQEFSTYFQDAPVIEVSGRGYPITIDYQPLNERPLEEAIYESVMWLWEEHGDGDVLVFLPGEREIRDVMTLLGKRLPPSVEILPLFARLPVARQNQIFRTTGKPRIVLATNVAETSLTVPGIIYVIDPGLARLSRYHYKSKLQRLDVEKISQASADQRAGRCGRIQSGTCVRLYSLEDFEERNRFTDPEILRTNLASVILQMAVLELGEIGEFAFLNRPDYRFVKDGYRLLEQLGAVDDTRHVTALGRKISRYPLDPRLGKILVEAVEDGCLAEIQIIAASLSAGDPRDRPWDKTAQADKSHSKFEDADSDFVTLLNIWTAWQALAGSNKERRQWCAAHFLSFRRLLEWRDIWRQLQRHARELGHVVNERPAAASQLHMTILKGFLDNIGERKTATTYTGARGRTFRIFPGSGLYKRNPRWIVAAEVVQTSQVFARCVARISPAWIEVAASHLLRSKCIDTFWSAERGCAMGVEELSLFGLVLSRRRRVHLTKYSRSESRESFIRHALVGNEWQCKEEFVEHNQQLREQLRGAETRVRRLMLDREKQYGFFYERLPEDIVDQRSFVRWWRSIKPNRPRYLYLNDTDAGANFALQPAWYPSTMTVAGQELKLSYVFDTHDERDGVTLHLPVSLLRHVQAAQIEWLIPGWLLDKTEFLFRGLAKSDRKRLAPITDRARQFVHWTVDEQLPGGQESLCSALSRFVAASAKLEVRPEDWPIDRTPAWMQLGIALEESDGNEIAWTRNLKELVSRFGLRTELAVRQTNSEWLRQDVTAWDFEQLPELVTVEQDGFTVNVCPALVDKINRVDMELLPTLDEALRVHGDGVRRLIAGMLLKKTRYLEKNLAKMNHLGILYMQIGEIESLFDDFIMAALGRLVPDAGSVRTASQFTERLRRCRADLIGEVQTIAELALSILTLRQKLLMVLDAEKNRFEPATFADIRQQLDDLVYAGFVRATPPRWFCELPRYLQALELRIGRIIDTGKEPVAMPAVVEQADNWRQLTEEQRQQKPDYQWMIEEWRVSVSAQKLGTRMPISQKRIDKYLST